MSDAMSDGTLILFLIGFCQGFVPAVLIIFVTLISQPWR
jgi:hypothetical protein